MRYLKRYVEENVAILSKMNPDVDEDKIRELIKEQVNKNIITPEVSLHNNLTKQRSKVPLTDLLGWMDKRVPVVSGNATFFMQPNELQSPTSVMLRSLKVERKMIKREMFSKTPGTGEYENLDLDQSNKKVIMNADYGGSGTKTAAFYSVYLPIATTMMARSIITTMANLFESVIGDNNKFMNIQECFDFMIIVTSQEIVLDKLPKWIVVPTKDEVKTRIKEHFYMYDISHDNTINQFIDTLSNNELTYLYYAHNLHTFIKNHPNIGNMFRNILSTLPSSIGENPTVESTNAMFMDPYHIPDIIAKDMDTITKLMEQFIYVPYITPDTIEKLNHHLRKTVILVDTDSNVLYMDPFVQFIKHDICKGETFGREDEYNDFIIINTAASFLDNMVKFHLDMYGRFHNMDNDARKELVMKNEYLFKTTMLLDAKKTYMTSIVLREGKLFTPYKTDIKGAQFIKSAVSEIVSNRFTKIMETNILHRSSPDIVGMIKDVQEFEREIITDMKSGGTRYLKTASVKAPSAYKNPWGIQAYKASEVWNAINPNEKIYPMDKCYIIKLMVRGITDVECIRYKYPEIYDSIKKNIYESPSNDIRKTHMTVIAIPDTKQEVPEWIVMLMDISTLSSDILSSFRSILDAVKAEFISVKTPTGKLDKVSNFIRF